jgi:hypothetical protein
MSGFCSPLRWRGRVWRCVVLSLAMVMVAGACSRIKLRAEGGSSSRTNWEIGIPF